jgi:hypothetical protein
MVRPRSAVLALGEAMKAEVTAVQRELQVMASLDPGNA